MLDHAQLLVESERAGQAAFEIGILLPLVEVASEDGIFARNAVIHAGLEIVRLGEIDAAELAEILTGEDGRVAEVRIGPERQIQLRDAIDSPLGNRFVGKRSTAVE